MGASHNKIIIGQAITAKLNARNPTDSLETWSITVLKKNSDFNSWWVDYGKIKESYLLFYASVAL